MLYVEKDLSQVVKIIMDKWDTEDLVLSIFKYFYVTDARVSPREYIAAVEKGTSRNFIFDDSYGPQMQVYGHSEHWSSRSRCHVYTL